MRHGLWPCEQPSKHLTGVHLAPSLLDTQSDHPPALAALHATERASHSPQLAMRPPSVCIAAETAVKAATAEATAPATRQGRVRGGGRGGGGGVRASAREMTPADGACGALVAICHALARGVLAPRPPSSRRGRRRPHRDSRVGGLSASTSSTVWPPGAAVAPAPLPGLVWLAGCKLTGSHKRSAGWCSCLGRAARQ